MEGNYRKLKIIGLCANIGNSLNTKQDYYVKNEPRPAVIYRREAGRCVGWSCCTALDMRTFLIQRELINTALSEGLNNMKQKKNTAKTLGWINQESCFDSSWNRPDRLKASLTLNLCQWRFSWGLSDRANEAGQLPAWRADVRNKWICTSGIPPTFTTCRGTNLVYLFFIVKPTRCTNV